MWVRHKGRATKSYACIAFREATLPETLLNSTISRMSKAINRLTFSIPVMSVSGAWLGPCWKQNNLNYSAALSLSGHPFNRIITSLFIHTRPGRYITSTAVALLSLINVLHCGAGWGGLTCAHWYRLTVCCTAMSLSGKGWRLNRLRPTLEVLTRAALCLTGVTPSHGVLVSREQGGREKDHLLFSMAPTPAYARH